MNMNDTEGMMMVMMITIMMMMIVDKMMVMMIVIITIIDKMMAMVDVCGYSQLRMIITLFMYKIHFIQQFKHPVYKTVCNFSYSLFNRSNALFHT